MIISAPPLTLVVTPNGSHVEGETYSLTCDLVGDESLDVADVNNRFRWDRLTPSFQEAILRAATLSFTPLTLADTGDYICTNNFVSPYLIGSITHTETFTVSITGNYISIEHWILYPGSYSNIMRPSICSCMDVCN